MKTKFTIYILFTENIDLESQSIQYKTFNLKYWFDLSMNESICVT